jgi:hypothetical protein
MMRAAKRRIRLPPNAASAMQSMPELAELSKQLIIDQTPEACVSSCRPEGRSMFDPTSARPTPAPSCCCGPFRGHQPAAQPHFDHRTLAARIEPGHLPNDWFRLGPGQRLAPDP